MDIDGYKLSEDITETEEQYFFKIISTELSEEQKNRIIRPSEIYPSVQNVLAVHWHPEFVPIDLIVRRIEAAFPNKQHELIIPTQHNVLMSYNGYSGVEVDCYAHGFNQKVQLLLHFKASKVENATVLKEMLSHTFKYRSSQLYEFIQAIIAPVKDCLNKAAKETGANETLIGFVQIYVRKIQMLLEKHAAVIPPESVKNKVLRNFFNCLRSQYGDALIDRAQTFLNAVKRIVKKRFALSYFYEVSEIIEEARSLGAGVVVPHPEQFWPILLADYDVDGYEVWNPQSQRYTEFLISALNRKNTSLNSSKKLLIFMGDDTHLGEKVRPPGERDSEKAAREIGVQPAWNDPHIRKSLIMANATRKYVIDEYKTRLG